jgi:hypothetical protein
MLFLFPGFYVTPEKRAPNENSLQKKSARDRRDKGREAFKRSKILI